MVVSANHLASQVGVDILKRGGNAVDAAVAVGFALAVVFPEAGNIGGGGYMLVRMRDGKAMTIDFREKAPGAATRGMYLDSLGKVTDQSLDGCRSVAVPGTVAGLARALKECGTLPLAEVIRPAIDLADYGFVVDRHLAGTLAEYADKLRRYSWPGGNAFIRDGKVLVEGDTIRQPDLSATLRRIQQDGADEFYRLETSRQIVAEMQRGGGIITPDDLSSYEPVVGSPIVGHYRGYDILSMGSSSSGGVCLTELLNVVEGFNLRAMGFHSSRSVHVMAEAMKRVYADRAEFLGDPAVHSVPVEWLTSKRYAEERRKEIDTMKATPSALVYHGTLGDREGRQTTHYAVVDSAGDVVSVTYTINDLFGSKVIVPGAGFFLNDEMDDFSAKPGVPNAFGLIGGDANAIEPGKRPLSSMAPTIVLKNGEPVMVVGARGGSRIITAVFQAIIDVIDYGMDIQEALDAPRIHHQWLPDELLFEKFCLPADVVENLESRGQHPRETAGSIGALEAIVIDRSNGWLYGASDPREGGVAIGY